MNDTEILNALTLALLFPYKQAELCELYQKAGSATNIVDNASSLKDILPDFNPSAFSIDTAMLETGKQRAQKELDYIREHSLTVLTPDMPAYPEQIKEVCKDYPLALFYNGNANLNSERIISIVGTRNSTPYGRDLVYALIEDLSVSFPDLVVVSGLAYGTDINAHRAALKCGLSTVAVLAHGLDTVYPAAHRQSAQDIINNGGLLTEYAVRSKPDRFHFLHRNRLIAALSKATIVVESKPHGGALVTASCANDYDRGVYAFPGRSTDEASLGCNNLIRNNEAKLINSAGDLAQDLGWNLKRRKNTPLPSLFDPELSGDEKAVYDLLNEDGVHISELTAKLSMPVHIIMQILSELEFRSLVQALPGSKWRKVAIFSK